MFLFIILRYIGAQADAFIIFFVIIAIKIVKLFNFSDTNVTRCVKFDFKIHLKSLALGLHCNALYCSI